MSSHRGWSQHRGVTRAACTLFVLAALVAAGSTARARPSGSRHAMDATPALYDSAGGGEIGGGGSAPATNGMPVTVAARTVVLRPVTDWSRQWWQRWVVGGTPLDSPDPRALSQVRKVAADSSGRFRFDHLPPGNYYVVSSVLWPADAVGGREARTRLTIVGAQVALAAGGHAAVTLVPMRTETLDPGPGRVRYDPQGWPYEYNPENEPVMR
jgi:hypothetical protein